MSESIFSSKFVDSYFVTTDNENTAKTAKNLGFSIAKLRESNLSNPKSTIEDVHCWHLKVLENELNYHPDIILSLIHI